MRRKPLFITLGSVLLLILLLISIGFWINNRFEQAAIEIPSGGSVVHVSLETPREALWWPLNAFIPLTVTAVGNQPLVKIDLYVNGVLYESRAVLGRITTATRTETLNWQPGTEGDFILLAHATDALGATGVSQPLLIRAQAAGGTTTLIQPQPGESMTSIASQAGVKIEDVALINPDLPADGPLPADEPIFVPGVPPAVVNPKIIAGLPAPAVEPVPTPAVDPAQYQIQLKNFNFPPQDASGDNQSPVEIPEEQMPAPADSYITPKKLGGIQSMLDLLKQDHVRLQALPPVLPGEYLTGQPETPDSQTTTGSNAFSARKTLTGLPKLVDILKNPAGEKQQQPPHEPEITAGFKDCEVTIRMVNAVVYVDPSDPAVIKMNESGFYLYRSHDGGPFERIATWSPIVLLTDTNNDPWSYGYKDPNQYGNVTYMVAAFNSLGEVPSSPVTVPLDPSTCKNSSIGPAALTKVRLIDGELVLPFAMDLAYFYIQVDTGDGKLTPAWRVPEGDRTFQPASGQPFNLYDYLASQLDKIQAPDLNITMQIWGWWGGKLIHAGNFKLAMHRSVLMICSVEGDGACTKDGAAWTNELTLSDQKPLQEQVYDVKWLSTSLSPVKDLCVQLAAGPYPNDDYWSVNQPINAYCMDAAGSQGTFRLQLGPTLFPDAPKSVEGWGNGEHLLDYRSNWFQFDYGGGKPFTLYLRALPRHESSGFNRYANIVPIHYKTQPVPSTLPPLASTFSSMYDIEIVEETYLAPNFATEEKWGCVIIDEDPTGTYAVGQEVCPGIVPPKDDCAGMSESECLLGGMGDAAGFVYDTFVQAYEVMKGTIAQGVTSLIPGCSSDPDCVGWIKKGVDYGASALTGLPVTMPSSEELVGDSVADYIISGASGLETYYTGSDISAIKAFCGLSDCKEEISQYVQTTLKSARSQYSQPACVSGYEAYFHGQQPVCLDPAIIVHPVWGAGNYPGSVMVKVQRKTTPESLAGMESDVGNYALDVSVTGTNNWNGYALEAPLYQTARVSLPWLKPGESTYLIAPLQPCKDEFASGCGGGVNYGGFDARYFGGVSHMAAVEACYSTGSTVSWVPCLGGGSDSWEFSNPATKTEAP